MVSTQILANCCTCTFLSTIFLINYVYFTCSTHVICTSFHSIIYQFHGWKCWREIWGGNFELKWEECFKCAFTFSIDIKQELENSKREGLWKMLPWHLFFKRLDNSCYVQRLRKLSDDEETYKQDLKKVENKIRAWK